MSRNPKLVFQRAINKCRAKDPINERVLEKAIRGLQEIQTTSRLPKEFWDNKSRRHIVTSFRAQACDALSDLHSQRRPAKQETLTHFITSVRSCNAKPTRTLSKERLQEMQRLYKAAALKAVSLGRATDELYQDIATFSNALK